MNRQEIFNFVSTHLFTQGERAMIGTYCAYLAKNGTTCAVGCMIPVDLLPNFGSIQGSVSALVQDDEKNELPEFFRTETDLLHSLQYVHDREDHWATTEAMRLALRSVAKDWKLDYSILDSLKFEDR